MQPICKNCKNFFNHHHNYNKVGFCRRFNQVQGVNDLNENCFIPNDSAERFHRNKAKAEKMGIDVNELPKGLNWESEPLEIWLKKQELKKAEEAKKIKLISTQIELF